MEHLFYHFTSATCAKGTFEFCIDNCCATLAAISKKAIACGVLSCITAGRPASPASQMLWINGISPNKGIPNSSASLFAPSFQTHPLLLPRLFQN